MNIAFLVSSFPKISETFIVNQITELLDAGHNVQIFAFNQPDEAEQHKIVREYDLLSRTHYLPSPETYIDGTRTLLKMMPELCIRGDVGLSQVLSVLRNGTKAPRQYGVFQELLRAERFDVYHAHFGPVGEAARPAVEAIGAPLVVSFYGHDISEIVNRNPNIYDRLFESSASVLALSNEMRNRLSEIGCPEEIIKKQPLLIDVSEYPFRERSTPIDEPVEVLTVARLVEKKGIRYAVEALAKVDVDREIQLRIIGDGPEREAVENTISRLDMEDNVDFLGFRDHENVKKWLHQSDLFVLPSVTATDGDQEGTPTVLLEAQASGLPVISTQHAGIPEIVSDGETGYLVPERDVPALSSAFETLLEQPEQWVEMGRAGRKLVEERHAPETHVRSLEAVYRDVSESGN